MKKLIIFAAAAAVLALPVAANADAQPTGPKCDPSYKLRCLKTNAYDYDCIGGRGNGPLYTDSSWSSAPMFSGSMPTTMGGAAT